MNLYCKKALGDPVHGPYHDDEYGLPRYEESVLFELLALEIFQAGLSWEIVLKKREAIFTAFEKFEVDRVAVYKDKDICRLLESKAIIRNKLKIRSIIENARRIQVLRSTYGGFADFLDYYHPNKKSDWIKLFKKTFVFTGKEIVNEFLMSLGYLPGAHHPRCPVYKKVCLKNPPWMQVHSAFFDD